MPGNRRAQAHLCWFRGGSGGQYEVPEIHNSDADGHGSDSLQQRRLHPSEETAVVSIN